MKVPSSKLGAILAGGYLVLVVAAVVLASVLVQANPPESGGSSLLTFLLTLPWSWLATVALGITNSGLSESYVTAFVVLGASAMINAVILYLLGAALGKVFSGTRRRA